MALQIGVIFQAVNISNGINLTALVVQIVSQVSGATQGAPNTATIS